MQADFSTRIELEWLRDVVELSTYFAYHHKNENSKKETKHK